jgi:hypothetical protein
MKDNKCPYTVPLPGTRENWWCDVVPETVWYKNSEMSVEETIKAFNDHGITDVTVIDDEVYALMDGNIEAYLPPLEA